MLVWPNADFHSVTAVKTQHLTGCYTSVSFIVSLSMTVVLQRSSTSARMFCDSSHAQRHDRSGIQGCPESLLTGTFLTANKIVVLFIGGSSIGTKLSYRAMCNWELYLLCAFL